MQNTRLLNDEAEAQREQGREGRLESSGAGEEQGLYVFDFRDRSTLLWRYATIPFVNGGVRVVERTVLFSFRGFGNEFREEAWRGFGQPSKYFFASLFLVFSNRVMTISTKSSLDRSSCRIVFSVIPSVRGGWGWGGEDLDVEDNGGDVYEEEDVVVVVVLVEAVEVKVELVVLLIILGRV